MISNRLLGTLAISMCALFLASAFAGAAPGARFGEWQGAESLEALTMGTNSTSPATAFDQVGRGVAAWLWEYRGELHVRASYHDPLEGWSEPVVIDSAGAVSSPVVAIDESGNAVVAWTWLVEGRLAVYGSAMEVYESWTAPQRLTFDTYDNISGLSAVANNASQLMVIFAGRTGNDTSILASNYRTDSGYDAQASVLVSMSDPIGNLSVASNGKSDIWVVWSRSGGGNGLIEGLNFDIVSWSPSPIPLAGPGALDPHISVDGKGRAMLIYQLDDEERAVVETRSYSNYLWYNATRLFDQAGTISLLRTTMSTAGNVTVAMLANTTSSMLMVADFNGTAWKGFAPITGTSGPVDSFELAITAGGDSLLVCQAVPSGDDDGFHMFYATREAGGNWTHARDTALQSSGGIQPGYALSATRADYWLIYSRTEVGATGEARMWANQFLGPRAAGALLTPYFFGLNSTVSSPLVEVAGWIEPYSAITVNDQTVVADRFGHFSAFIPLERGKNFIDLATVDSNGRTAHLVVHVSYEPNAITAPGLLTAGVGAAFLAATLAGLYLYLRRR